MNVEKGQWHRLECLESGTVIVEFKDGAYEPVVAEDAVPAMNVEIGQWHRLEALESGTVIVEFKNGPYVPISSEDIM